ncbi:hypothetical protein N7509_003105, partial [Penicillium cosmopolitanum]
SPKTPAPTSKRRRVAVACDACRTRKSRCDGTRPRCSLCRDLGFECIYTPPTTATNVIVQKDYLHGLEDRVKRLEGLFSVVRGEIDGLNDRIEGRVGNLRDFSDGGLGVRSVVNGNAQVEKQSDQVQVHVPDLTGTEDSVDGMGAVTLADEEDSGFFGPSSNIAFLRHLSRAVVQQGYLLSPGAAEGGFVSASRPPSPPRRQSGDRKPQVNLFSLPPQTETLAMIQRYFSNTGLLFPYIYPPVFLETYHQMNRENFTKVRRTWLGLLNMVLAMSTMTAATGGAKADVRIAESDVFYERGLGLCGSEILRGTTLEVVQFLLLMGQYLQGTQKSVQAWTVHGLAVKAALQLGLHSRNASKSFSTLEQEMRKRTWYGCVVLDRTLSMTFGRPAAIPDNYVKLDLPSKRDFDESSALVNDETTFLSLTFFNSTITLYKQLWNVLDLLYGQNIGCDGPLPTTEVISNIFTMEQRLFSWERSLDPNLQLISTSQLDGMPRDPITTSFEYYSWKLRVILSLRYLNLRVLLHRPVLVKFIAASRCQNRDPQDLKLLQQMGMNSMQICIESAMEIIGIVHGVVSEPGWKHSLLGAWWFSLYYTFNAALAIIGAVWVYRDESLSTTSMATQAKEAEKYPGLAAEALSKLDDGNRLVDRCRYYLQQFNTVLNRISTGRYPPFPSLNSARGTLPPADFGLSPFGMELGEFMMDDDLVAMIDRQGILSMEPGSAYHS